MHIGYNIIRFMMATVPEPNDYFVIARSVVYGQNP